MLEITNKNKFQVQLIIRSRTTPKSFTVKNIPGIGKKNNVYLLEDERAIPIYIQRAKDEGLIDTRHIPNTIRKGE